MRHILFIAVALLVTIMNNAEADTMPSQPKVIIFDVNETLLDMEAMRESVGEALNGQPCCTTHWYQPCQGNIRTSGKLAWQH